MWFIKNIIQWFINCWKSVPENIVTGIFSGLLFWLGRLLLNKAILHSTRLNIFCKRVVEFWHTQPNIEQDYKVIPSPNYEFSEKSKKGKSSSVDNGGIIISMIAISIMGCLWLREYQEAVQKFFYLICVTLIGLSTFFILISAFTNRIQSSTLKFSIFSILISAYIYYSGEVLPELIKRMPPDINLVKLLVEPQKYWPSIYTFLGLVIVTFEIVIILFMLFRVIAIKLDSRVQFKLCKKVIYYTKAFENTIGVIFLFGMLTIFSYLLTSNIFIEMIFKF